MKELTTSLGSVAHKPTLTRAWSIFRVDVTIPSLSASAFARSIARLFPGPQATLPGACEERSRRRIPVKATNARVRLGLPHHAESQFYAPLRRRQRHCGVCTRTFAKHSMKAFATANPAELSTVGGATLVRRLRFYKQMAGKSVSSSSTVFGKGRRRCRAIVCTNDSLVGMRGRSKQTGEDDDDVGLRATGR